MDGASGAILDCENCNEPIPPASMAKLMTVLIVLEELRSGEWVTQPRSTPPPAPAPTLNRPHP